MHARTFGSQSAKSFLQMSAYLSLLEDKNIVVDEEAVHDWVIGPLNDIWLRVKVSHSIQAVIEGSSLAGGR